MNIDVISIWQWVSINIIINKEYNCFVRCAYSSIPENSIKICKFILYHVIICSIIRNYRGCTSNGKINRVVLMSHSLMWIEKSYKIIFMIFEQSFGLIDFAIETFPLHRKTNQTLSYPLHNCAVNCNLVFVLLILHKI